MIRMLMFTSIRQELEEIAGIIKNQAALLSEDRWELHHCFDLPQVRAFLKDEGVLDVICFDVTVRQGIGLLEELRARNAGAYIILIANTGISPVTYIKPTIMAACLLLRPLERERVQETVVSLLQAFQKETESDEVLVLEDEDGRIRIPYRNILYFEARNKKIYVCTENREYGFYDTLEQLCGRLPELFVRCHRGFIVNTGKIKRVSLTEGLIYLKEGYAIPLSRSYRQVMKEYR